MDGPDGVADVTERLLAEFDIEQDLATIASVVLGCRAELAAVPAAALPELLERLGRQRLQEHRSVRPATSKPANAEPPGAAMRDEDGGVVAGEKHSAYRPDRIR